MLRSIFGDKGFTVTHQYQTDFLELTYSQPGKRNRLKLPLESNDKKAVEKANPRLAEALVQVRQFAANLGGEFNPDIDTGLRTGFEESELRAPPVQFVDNCLRLSYPFIYFVSSNEEPELSLGLSPKHLRELGVPRYEMMDVEIKQNRDPTNHSNARLDWTVKTQALENIFDFTMVGCVLRRKNGAEYLLYPELSLLLRKLRSLDEYCQTEEYKTSTKLRLAAQSEIRSIAERLEVRLQEAFRRQRVVALADMAYDIQRGLHEEVVVRPLMPAGLEELDYDLQISLLQMGEPSTNAELTVGGGDEGVRLIFSDTAIDRLKKIMNCKTASQEELEEAILDPEKYFGSKPGRPIDALFSQRVDHLIFGKSKSVRESGEGSASWVEGFEGNSVFWQDTRGVVHNAALDQSHETLDLYTRMKTAILQAERAAKESGKALTLTDSIEVEAADSPFERHEILELCKRIERIWKPILETEDEIERAKDVVDRARHNGTIVVEWSNTDTGELNTIPLQSLEDALPRPEHAKRSLTNVTLGAEELCDNPPPGYLTDQWDWDEPTLDSQFSTPLGFKSEYELHPHQVLGASWLSRIATGGGADGSCARGALLADDMGVGKTIQVLAFLTSIMQDLASSQESILIVAPVSLIKNAWLEDGFRKFFTRKAIFIDGIGEGPEVVEFDACPVKINKKKLNEEAYRWQAQMDETGCRLADCDIDFELREPLERLREWMQGKIVLCSYETLRINSLALGAVDFRAVILDEAQKIKNESALQAHAAKALKSKMNIAMTGTPIENSILDLWNLVDFVSPGKLGPKTSFRSHFLAPLRESEAGSPERKALREELERQLSPIWLRRTKDQVFTEGQLPKIYHYDSMADEVSGQRMNKHAAPMSPEVFRSKYKNAAGIFADAKAGEGLVAIQKMLQLCIAPWLSFGEAATWANHKRLFELAPKLKVLFDILDEIRSLSPEAGQKVLIFCNLIDVQVSLGALIEDWQESVFGQKIEVQIFNGDISSKVREQRLQKFTNATGFQVMILSPKAGGVGLNLQEANHVIHYTREWNPAIEKQATARAYRLGQNRPVHVYYPTTTLTDFNQESAEEILAKMLTSKRDVMDDFTFSIGDFAITEQDFSEKINSDPDCDPIIGFEDLPTISYSEFEKLVYIILENRGYDVSLIAGPNDGGSDVLAMCPNGRQPNLIVQAKHTSRMAARIQKEAITQVYGHQKIVEGERGRPFKPVAVTNAYFSETALRYAQHNNVETWDKDWLEDEMKDLTVRKSHFKRIRRVKK